MRLKSYIYFNKSDKQFEFVDKPVTFDGIEVGKILASNLDTITGSMEITMQIYEHSAEIIRELVKGKHIKSKKSDLGVSFETIKSSCTGRIQCKKPNKSNKPRSK